VRRQEEDRRIGLDRRVRDVPVQRDRRARRDRRTLKLPRLAARLHQYYG
jgi:hypothetical protein